MKEEGCVVVYVALWDGIVLGVYSTLEGAQRRVEREAAEHREGIAEWWLTDGEWVGVTPRGWGKAWIVRTLLDGGAVLRPAAMKGGGT